MALNEEFAIHPINSKSSGMIGRPKYDNDKTQLFASNSNTPRRIKSADFDVSCNRLRRMIADALLITLLAMTPGCHLLTNQLGGAFDAVPEDLETELSPEAAALVDKAFSGLDPLRLADAHVHHISREVHPGWLSWSNPVRRLRTDIFLSGAGVEWADDVEQRYIARLERLASHFSDEASFLLYALDRTYDAEGNFEPDHTPIYVSNVLAPM